MSALAANPVEPVAATGDMKGRVLLWSTATVDPIAELTVPTGLQRSRIRSLAFSSEGVLAIATDWAGTVEIWKNTSFVESLRAHSAQTTAVAWTHGGLLVTGGTETNPAAADAAESDSVEDSIAAPIPAVRVWRGKIPTLVLNVRGTGLVRALSVSDDDRWLAAGIGETTWVWQLASGTPVAELGGVGEITSVTFRAEGLVIAGSKGARVAPVGTFTAGPVQSAVRGSAASGFGDDLLVAGDFDAVHLFRSPGFAPAGDLPGRAYAVCAVGAELWVATADTLLRLDRTGSLLARRSFRAP